MPKPAVTPAIQAKASELARGRATAAEKERAIYDYVSTGFQYVSISLGDARYQPHAADEVLSNLYGDCKDKIRFCVRCSRPPESRPGPH